MEEVLLRVPDCRLRIPNPLIRLSQRPFPILDELRCRLTQSRAVPVETGPRSLRSRPADGTPFR